MLSILEWAHYLRNIFLFFCLAQSFVLLQVFWVNHSTIVIFRDNVWIIFGDWGIFVFVSHCDTEKLPRFFKVLCVTFGLRSKACWPMEQTLVSSLCSLLLRDGWVSLPEVLNKLWIDMVDVFHSLQPQHIGNKFGIIPILTHILCVSCWRRWNQL